MPTPARWWEATERTDEVLCTLCPRLCRLGDGQSGFCFVRKNEGGRLVSLAYGTATGFAVDPIEKKPLSHFLPGTNVLSFGTAGCNLGCKFCQNWSISKARIAQTHTVRCDAEQVVALAKRRDCPSIACTYNDPIIYAEWMDDVGRAARRGGLKMVAVTAGYVTESAREAVFEHVDACNVDLKAFSEKFYRKQTLSHLAPVLQTLEWLATTSIWFEVTTLLIEGYNDSLAELREQTAWMMDRLGPDVPLHLTAFHPDYKLTDAPRTSLDTLRRAREIALEAGLRYVYVGNVHDEEGQTTRCPGCARAVIRRDWHRVLEVGVQQGSCPHCGHRIAGVFAP